MAYAKKNQNFKAYVQIPLLPEMVEEINSFSADDVGLLQALTELLDKGYLVKIHFSPDEGTYQLAAIQNNPSNPDEGLGYYSGGATLGQAIAASWVKQHFLEKAKKSLRDQEAAGRPKLY